MRLLLIDGIQTAPPDIPTDIIRPKDGQSPDHLKIKIAECFGHSNYDVIALGNHNEVGLKLLTVIPRIFRRLVVVLSNTPLTPEVEKKYRAQDVQYFSLRGEPFATFIRQHQVTDSFEFVFHEVPDASAGND